MVGQLLVCASVFDASVTRAIVARAHGECRSLASGTAVLGLPLVFLPLEQVGLLVEPLVAGHLGQDAQLLDMRLVVVQRAGGAGEAVARELTLAPEAVELVTHGLGATQ